jgi:hypothetical protein
MQAVVPAVDSHDLLANAHRGRHRSVSAAFPPAQRHEEPPKLPKAASYTYFPRVKDLDEPSILGLKGSISEDQLRPGGRSDDGNPYSSSDGSSPDSEDAPQAEQMPQMKPAISRRASRFLPFSTKNREPSEEPRSRRSRQETRDKADSGPSSLSPKRSLSKLRRKSWISSQSRSNSPTKQKEIINKSEESVKGAVPKESSKRRSLTSPLSIPGTEDVTPKDANSKSRVLTKKAKRPLSTLFNTTNGPRLSSSVPAVPQIPKSFSTDKLPITFALSPQSPSHIPPLPRNVSTEKLKGVKTEPRKKDELWTVFRTLEGDLRKYVPTAYCTL